ncbi:hypothetical protein GC175_18560 [bacterium]|nr:hypothetical protein [bacterium]
MTFIQRVIARLPQSWYEAIRAESEEWVFTCPACGLARSVWEIGGVRYKAVSVGKRSLVWCSQCKQMRMMPLQRQPGD